MANGEYRDMRAYIKERMEYILMLAEDGAYGMAARSLGDLTKKVHDHAEWVASMESMSGEEL